MEDDIKPSQGCGEILTDLTVDSTTDWIIAVPPEPNMHILLGDDLEFRLSVKRTIKNRLKFWLMYKLLPFKVTRWE